MRGAQFDSIVVQSRANGGKAVPQLGSVLIVACWTIPFIAVDGLSGT
jgi:hypothetical protein